MGTLYFETSPGESDELPDKETLIGFFFHLKLSENFQSQNLEFTNMPLFTGWLCGKYRGVMALDFVICN